MRAFTCFWSSRIIFSSAISSRSFCSCGSLFGLPGGPRRLLAEFLLGLLQGVAHVGQGVDDVLLDALRVLADVRVVEPLLDAEHVLADLLEDRREGDGRAFVLEKLDRLVGLTE